MTLVAGSAGAGKTLLGLNFLVAGARQYGEPGVLLTFEESAAKVSTVTVSAMVDTWLQLRNTEANGERSAITNRVIPPGRGQSRGTFPR